MTKDWKIDKNDVSIIASWDIPNCKKIAQQIGYAQSDLFHLLYFTALHCGTGMVTPPVNQASMTKYMMGAAYRPKTKPLRPTQVQRWLTYLAQLRWIKAFPHDGRWVQYYVTPPTWLSLPPREDKDAILEFIEETEILRFKRRPFISEVEQITAGILKEVATTEATTKATTPLEKSSSTITTLTSSIYRGVVAPVVPTLRSIADAISTSPNRVPAKDATRKPKGKFSREAAEKWYTDFVFERLGITPIVTPNDRHQFTLKKGSTTEEWEEWYAVMKVMIARWKMFCAGNEKLHLPRYPKFHWYGGAWHETFYGFYRRNRRDVR